jgi:hypothetical protein
MLHFSSPAAEGAAKKGLDRNPKLLDFSRLGSEVDGGGEEAEAPRPGGEMGGGGTEGGRTDAEADLLKYCKRGEPDEEEELNTTSCDVLPPDLFSAGLPIPCRTMGTPCGNRVR